MALLTPMTLAEARQLGAGFGLDVHALRPVPAGSVNSNFELGTAGGERFFLRVFEESPHAAVERQNALLARLAAAGVPTPVPLALAAGAGTIAEHQGKAVSVFPFVPGEHLCQARLSPAHLARVGEALARVHVAGAGVQALPANRFGRAELAARLANLEARELPGEIEQLVPELRAGLDELAAHGAPGGSAVVHGDVFRDNVLWRDGELVGLLDFESASAGEPVFDLMVTLLAWCFSDRLERLLAQALVAGYRRVRALGEAELAAAWGAARFAALRFTITRITDYELRPRGVVVYKDFRRFLARLRAVEALGASGFRAWLEPG